MRMRRSLVPLLLLAISLTAAGQQPTGQPPAGQSPGNPAPASRAMPGAPNGAPVVDVFALMDRLAVEMDKEFILDPRLRGLMGLSTAREDADYDTLLAILRATGYAAVESGDQIRIVPDSIGRSEPSPIVQEDDSRISDHTIVTRIIDISGLQLPEVPGQNGAPASAAAQLVPMLRPLMSTAIGNIASIPGGNKMIIVDRYDNVRRITAIVDELRQ